MCLFAKYTEMSTVLCLGVIPVILFYLKRRNKSWLNKKSQIVSSENGLKFLVKFTTMNDFSVKLEMTRARRRGK